MDGDECCICFKVTENEVRITLWGCNHWACRDCVWTWKQQPGECKCPLCRAPQTHAGARRLYAQVGVANVIIDEEQGETPLISAASAGDMVSLNMLLEVDGIDVDAMDLSGFSALHCAASRGHLEIIAALVHSHADVDCADESGFTPLMAAVINNEPESVSALLAAGADPNIADEHNGGTPYDAARRGSMAANVEMVELLRVFMDGQ